MIEPHHIIPLLFPYCSRLNISLKLQRKLTAIIRLKYDHNFALEIFSAVGK